MINDKVKRMKSFEFKIRVKWFDLDGYYHLPIPKEDLRSGKSLAKMVRISLLTDGIFGEYEKLVVKLFCPRDGAQIDGKSFLFSDYLEMGLDRPLSAGDKLAISKYIDYRWIVPPVSTRPICEAIEQWIDMFREI